MKSKSTEGASRTAHARRVPVKRVARGVVPMPAKPGPAFKRLVLRLHSIECVKDTREFDRDEMVLVGLGTSVTGKAGGQARAKTRERRRLSLGKFKKGSKETYKKPKEVVSFLYGGAQAEWPRTYPAVLLLIEKDEGQIGKIAAQVAGAVDKKIAVTLKEAASTVVGGAAAAIGAGAAAGSVVPLIGTAAGAAVAAGVMSVSSAIQKSRADDPFPPRPAPLHLKRPPDKAGQLAGSRKTHVLSAHKGIYKLVTSWWVE